MRRDPTPGIAVALTLATLIVGGCDRSAIANQAVTKEVTPETAGSIQSVGLTAKPQFDEPAFSLSIAPKGVLDKGQTGELTVVLTAKAPYHVNQEYPHRFKITATRGLTTPSNLIQRDLSRVTPPRLELAVPVTLGQTGPFGLDGEMSFSLCTAEKCLMEKRQLTASVGAS